MEKNILLVAVNAKYIHCGLGVLYLKAYAKEHLPSNTSFNVEDVQYSINDQILDVCYGIVSKHPKYILFSCYIWNIEFVLKVASTLKKMDSELVIALGGPEISFDPQIYLKNEYIDLVLCHEGERVFLNLINNDFNGRGVAGVGFKEKNVGIIVNSAEDLIENLDIIPFPYTTAYLKQEKNRIVYYESSRGCPYKCSYCLSSTVHSVRYFSMDRVKRDLMVFIENNVPLVKFVDRTFNASKKRACEIMKFISENSISTRFHCEIAVDYIDDEFIEIIRNSKKDLFQFEIGIQSTNSRTLEAIKRENNMKAISRNISRLIETGKCHVHTDLIAGLPYEHYNSFVNSFNEVFAMGAHNMQLGFLKLLKGSDILSTIDEHGYKYLSYPPYEVICNKYITSSEIMILKKVEDVLEKYHNKGGFEYSVAFAIKKFTSPFEFFKTLSDFFETINKDRQEFSKKQLYDIFYEFYTSRFGGEDVFAQILTFDFHRYFRESAFPFWQKIRINEKQRREYIKFLNNPKNIERFLPKYINETPKQILKNINFQVFSINPMTDNFVNNSTEYVYLFDIIEKVTINITNFVENGDN